MSPNPNISESGPIVLNNMGDRRFNSPSIIPMPEYDKGPPAVEVVNACKSFSKGVPVLKNYNMTVQQGTIYALLGSSGCGKTTILSCIVGSKLDSGDILVFGRRPGTAECGIPGRKVGYMPQDIALYRQLTIKEMLEYFGRIYMMTHSEIMSRIEVLTSFLDLPPSSRRIEDLSGGQARRVSLATCLLHEPALLILDEPTVGVDPLLRENIWTYLCDLVAKKSTTVIITTHYIEEARQANTIGLMRNGRLLVEKAPEDLLKAHGAILLEDIVLKLCRNDVAGFGETHHEEVAQTLTESSFYSRRKNIFKPSLKPEAKKEDTIVGIKFKPNPADENQNKNQTEATNQLPRRQLVRTVSIREKATQGIWGKFCRIRALAVRNVLTLMRSPLFMLAIFVMPSFQVIVTNLTLGPEPKNLAFGIVNPEINDDLSKCDSISNKCGAELLSCQYIKTLPNNIISPVAVSSKEQALKDVQIGKLWGYMDFPQNYSKYLIERGAAGMFAENETIDGSTISFRMDYSNYFASALLTKSLYESFQVFIQKTLTTCDQNPHKADLPLHFRKPVYGTLDITFHDYIAPAVLLIILFFIPYLSCSVYNITDRKQGTLERSMVAGIKMTDLLSAFFVTEGFLIIAQTLIAYLLVLFIFQMEIKGSVVGFLLIIILTGVAGLSLGFLIAQLVDEEIEALILGVGFYLPNLIFCGIIWPLEAAPWYIRSISYCLPCTWAISGVRSIISRGWPVTHQYVWPAYAVLLAWILFTWIMAAIFFRNRSK